MTPSWQMVVHYLIAGEESRLGRKDHWDQVFLAEKTPRQRKLMEGIKILLVIALSFGMMVALTRL